MARAAQGGSCWQLGLADAGGLVDGGQRVAGQLDLGQPARLAGQALGERRQVPRGFGGGEVAVQPHRHLHDGQRLG